MESTSTTWTPFRFCTTRYLLLFERTIGSFFQRLGWGGTLDMQRNPDSFHYVRANHLEYHRPVVGVNDVRARVWVEKLGTTSLTFGFALLPMDQDTDFATGYRVLVRVDPETKVPVSWTESFRTQIAPYVRKA
jgi:acyl-CoA thioester hydrolase